MRRTNTKSPVADRRQWYVTPTRSDICYGDGTVEGFRCGCPKHRPQVWEQEKSGEYTLLPIHKRGLRIT